MINLEVVKTQIDELNLLSQCDLFYNGQDVYNAALTILNGAKDSYLKISDYLESGDSNKKKLVL